MQLYKALAAAQSWTGSLDALVEKANALSRNYPGPDGRQLPDTTRWVVIDYRSQQIIEPAKGKSYSWPHLAQLMAARWLIQQGWSRERISTWIKGQSTAVLLKLLETGDLPDADEARPEHAPADLDRAVIATRLLAAGVVEQFALSRAGQTLIHDEGLSEPLVRAMFMLSAMHVSEQLEDEAGSAHDLLERCRHPFGGPHWRPRALAASDFPYFGIRLIDADSRVPTLDCAELAKNFNGELDLREQLAFRELRNTAESFIGREAEAYTLLRRFVAEHPFATLADLRSFERQHQLQAAAPFLASCYGDVLPHHLAAGALHLCPVCRTPRGTSVLPGHVACRTRQCRLFDSPEPVGTAVVPHEDLLIAKPHVLMYWVGPALDELQLFHTARSAGLNVVLYPELDSCDISLDTGTTGIDVKSHSSPFLLSESLRRSIGGLALYKNRMVAVNDQSIRRFPGYMRILQRECAGLGIQIFAVSALRDKLESGA